MSSEQERPHKAGVFDIRTIIAMLLGVYGVVLILVGAVGTDDAEIDRSAGVNVNLWTGIGLIVVAGLFVAWARLRPVVVDPDTIERDD